MTRNEIIGFALVALSYMSGVSAGGGLYQTTVLQEQTGDADVYVTNKLTGSVCRTTIGSGHWFCE